MIICDITFIEPPYRNNSKNEKITTTLGELETLIDKSLEPLKNNGYPKSVKAIKKRLINNFKKHKSL